ncbi:MULTISPECIES: DNA-processing protein DprA [Bacillaceae]|uniref:DNA-processing protein DprA n=1 Tax=Evansella alkalicola TaxID=745819 RepID=A0ABS6JP14_9BACI|nr:MULTISPECIES: DNA-processing protein DprA [Bacillaceae]MBU9720306.1 DNA-processing protein DprA [Bacillus alkalicola]
MNKIIDRLLHIHYCCYGNCRIVTNIFQQDPTLTEVYKMDEWDLIKKCHFPQKQAIQFIRLLKEVNCEKLKIEYNNKGINYISIFDADYPPLLKTIYDPPLIIYYQGNKQLFSLPHHLSVVGTRHPSHYIKDELEKVLQPVLERNIVIVSGMALGVDKMAHETTILYNGHTIGVLAYGLDHIYPLSNKDLFQSMKKDHLLMSEYPPYVRPQKWQFPERNRLISGLSRGTLVVEAKERSGSLITSDLALQQGRDVYAFPGRIFSEESIGTNKLIQEGAKMILHGNDILEEYF